MVWLDRLKCAIYMYDLSVFFSLKTIAFLIIFCFLLRLKQMLLTMTVIGWLVGGLVGRFNDVFFSYNFFLSFFCGRPPVYMSTNECACVCIFSFSFWFIVFFLSDGNFFDSVKIVVDYRARERDSYKIISYCCSHSKMDYSVYKNMYRCR